MNNNIFADGTAISRSRVSGEISRRSNNNLEGNSDQDYRSHTGKNFHRVMEMMYHCTIQQRSKFRVSNYIQVPYLEYVLFLCYKFKLC